MTNIPPMSPRTTPRMTFSAMVDILSQPSYRLPAILKDHKYPARGPIFGYRQATEQLVSWFVDGTALDPSAPGLRDYEVAALNAAQQAGTPAGLWPPGAVRATHPPKSSLWSLNGVEISFSPDVLLEGTVKRTNATGAVKLYLRKDPTTVGPMMAALLFFHRSQIACDPDVDPALCAVTDVQAGMVYSATGSFQRVVAQVQAACQVIASVWPSI